MTRNRFVLMCCVLVFATPTFGQSRGAAADPLSGMWTGELIRPDHDDPISITMKLQFDGKTAVSGTVSGLPSPADVKTGTFNPTTGALKLQLGKTGDSAVLLVFEGIVAKGTATGRVTGDIGTAEFKISKKG